jgi:hypothetical protein
MTQHWNEAVGAPFRNLPDLQFFFRKQTAGESTEGRRL